MNTEGYYSSVADDKYREALACRPDYAPVVTAVDLRITTVLDEGAARSPADFQAALSLLLSRHDVDVSLWDLVRDPALCTSLPMPERQEVLPAPASPAEVPRSLRAAAATRASFLRELDERTRLALRRAEDERRERTFKESEARPRFHERRWQSLRRRGWRMWDRKLGDDSFLKAKPLGTEYHYPLGAKVRWSDFYPRGPILYFLLRVNKGHLAFELKAPPFGFNDQITGYLNAHSEALERLSGQRPAGEVICRFQGQGWDSQFDNWEETLKTIDTIVAHLKPTLDALKLDAKVLLTLQAGIERDLGNEPDRGD